MRLIALVLAISLLGSGAEARAPSAPHYDIQLRLDPAHEAIAVDLRLTLPPSAEPQRFLLGGSYQVSQLEAAGGATIEVAPPPGPGAPQTITVQRGTARANRPIRVHLVYAGPLSPTDGINTVSPTRLELSADSLWYPLSMNFNTRVTVDARVDGVPEGFVPVSVDRVRVRRGGFQIHRAAPRPDIAFSAAPGLHEVTRGALHFFARDPDTNQARNYLEYGPRAVAYLEGLYGPLPGNRVVVAVVERHSGVGYSRPGYVVVADLGVPIADDNLWARAGYIAHEISHNYWSNADFTGEDYWLVESTAEYSALRFIEDIYGVDARQRLLDGKQARSQRGGPILGGGRPSDNAVYAKGPILLFALEQRIGRPALQRVLANLAARDHITTRDFLTELGAVAGAAEATAFEAELRQ